MSNQSVQTVSTTNDKFKVVLAVVAAIAGVVGFFYLAGQPTLVRAAALVVGLLISAGIAYTSASGREFLSFAKEAVRETKKVVWPTRKEATQITLLVFGFVTVMAIFLYVTDKGLEYLLYHVILGWKQ
jgi:preprotein translocase subunit SecE